MVKTILPTNVHLTRDEFAKALRCGQGRAFLHVQQHGLEGVTDLVLQACLNDQNYGYSTWIDWGHIPWLFQLIEGAPQYPEIQKAVVAKLVASSGSYKDIHLYALAIEMAKAGDAAAWEVLREQVRKIVYNAEGEADGDLDIRRAFYFQTWEHLEGLEGRVDLMRHYGQRLLAQPSERVPNGRHLFVELEELQAALNHYAGDPAVKAYRDYLDAQGVLTPPEDRWHSHEEFVKRRRREFTMVDTLNAAAQKIGDIPRRYFLFGRYATSEELREVYARLLTELDEDVCLRLLWVFRHDWFPGAGDDGPVLRGASLPEVGDRLFQWAGGPNPALRSAATRALAGTRDERVHALARAKVRDGHLLGLDQDALDLFGLNYAPDDAGLIVAALCALRPNPDELDAAQSLAESLVNLSEVYLDPALTDALYWVCENAYELLWRCSAVKLLGVFDRLDAGLRAECAFDMEESTCRLARTFEPEQLHAFCEAHDVVWEQLGFAGRMKLLEQY